MRIIESGLVRDITQHGSRGFSVQPLVRSAGVAVTVLRVAAGGEIGRHPAVGDQLLLVLSGRAAVCGGDEVWHDITAGQAVLWDAGEEHTTRAYEDLVALSVESPTLSTVDTL